MFFFAQFCYDSKGERRGTMTEAKQRAKKVRQSGIVRMKESGAVSVNWEKAIRSSLLKDEVSGMRRIYNKRRSRA